VSKKLCFFCLGPFYLSNLSGAKAPNCRLLQKIGADEKYIFQTDAVCLDRNYDLPILKLGAVLRPPVGLKHTVPAAQVAWPAGWLAGAPLQICSRTVTIV